MTERGRASEETAPAGLRPAFAGRIRSFARAPDPAEEPREPPEADEARAEAAAEESVEAGLAEQALAIGDRLAEIEAALARIAGGLTRIADAIEPSRRARDED